MDIKAIILVFVTLGFSSAANSALVSHGELSSDGSVDNIITDTLNNYEWLRFDVLKELTYSETVAVLDTQDGGSWSIATNVEAMMFVESLLAPSVITSCNSLQLDQTLCGNVAGWSDGDFGDDHDAVNDIVWFHAQQPNSLSVGNITVTGSGDVKLNGSWSTFANSDKFSDDTSSPSVSWLLYREIAVVPVPAAVWLFASGLLGLVAVARRKSE